MPDWNLTAQGFRIFPFPFFTQSAEEPKNVMLNLNAVIWKQNRRNNGIAQNASGKHWLRWSSIPASNNVFPAAEKAVRRTLTVSCHGNRWIPVAKRSHSLFSTDCRCSIFKIQIFDAVYFRSQISGVDDITGNEFI